MDSLVNLIHAVSVVGKCVFDSNYEKYFPLTIELFNLIFSCSNENVYFGIFEEVYYAVRYVNPKEKSKCVQKLLEILMNIYIYI